MTVPTHLVGKRVGDNRIELVALLGEGSYGAVYRGLIHRGAFRKPKLCAVKALRTNLDKHLLLCQRRELELHERVSGGEGVVTLYETFKEGNYQFIIMKFCSHGDLWYGINKGRYLGNDTLIKDVFTQVIDATEYCHSQGVYHRDIKPENILLCNGGHKVLLADFGLATSDQITAEMRSGSPCYMSPECWGGMHDKWNEPYAAAPNDIWSLGILLLNLACGKHAPWKYAHQHDRFFRDFLKQPNLLRLFVPLSPPVHDILARIFEPNPAARITLQDLKNAIKNIKYFAVPSAHRSEYHEYQCAVWKAVIGDTSSRPSSLKIIPITQESLPPPAIDKDDSIKIHREVSLVPFDVASPEVEFSPNIIIVEPAGRADSRVLPVLPRSSSPSTSSVNSDGPVTPDMPATIPDIEVPDITASYEHCRLQPIINRNLAPPAKTPEALFPVPVDSWQSILDAISAL